MEKTFIHWGILMNSRERVRTALQHKEPDRVPFDFGGTTLTSAEKDMQKRITDILGLGGEPDPRFGNFDDRIQKYFETDLRSIKPRVAAKWGFKKIHDAPLRNATIDDLDAYRWPEPSDEMVKGLREEAAFLHNETDYFICSGQMGQGIFELGCWLRGYDQILMDMGLDHQFVHAFNSKVLATNKRLVNLYFGEIGEYIDMVLIGDDLAQQSAPFMSVDMFRELYKPYFAEYIASIREKCPNAFIGHHCCGASYMLLDDFAQIGVQVINPVQTTAEGMTPARLAEKKDILSFHGGVDLQHILPYGTEQEVEEFVKYLLKDLAPGGGYILAPCHTLPNDVKPENVITMFEAVRKWGSYPLSDGTLAKKQLHSA